MVSQSTLVLLEHVNVNVPSHVHMVPFYLKVLGFGLDTRRAKFLRMSDEDNSDDATRSKTIWADCGASQFHLPYGDPAQCVPGEIGLRYDSLEGLKERLFDNPDPYRSCYKSAELVNSNGENESIKVLDHYGNLFHCRTGSCSEQSVERKLGLKQPLVGPNDSEQFGSRASLYGREESECRGIDSVNFYCPKGTASKIAKFYEYIFRATTKVCKMGEEELDMATIGFGTIYDDDGSSESKWADQVVNFLETENELAEYDGHHIALYVDGNKSKEGPNEYEDSFNRALKSKVIWINPRFADRTDTLEKAREECQYRFKDILDVETGEVVLELEHEVRSMHHESWPGKK